MKTLILLSSDVNSTTISGETPLMKAIAFYQPKAVNLLLRYGANPFLTNIVVRVLFFNSILDKYVCYFTRHSTK